MPWYDNENNNENYSGFNAEDYMQNLESLSGPQGNAMEGFWNSIKGDYNTAQGQWKDTMKGYENYHEKTQGWADKVQGYWDERNIGREQNQDAARQATEEFGQRVSGMGQDYFDKMKGWSDQAESVMTQSTTAGREYVSAGVEKYKQMEQELTDYSQQALSAGIKGETERMKMRAQSSKDQARRSGAPQSVLDQIDYQSEQDLHQGIQQGISSQAQSWQQQIQQAGGRYANSLTQQGQMEGQFGTMDYQAAQMGVQTKAKGLDFKMQMDLTSNAAKKQLELDISNQTETAKSQELVSMLSAESVELQGSLDYAEAIRNNPAVSASTVFSTLFSMMSAPGYKNFLSKAGVPGQSDKALGGQRSSLRQQYSQSMPYVDFNKVDPGKFNKWASQMNSYNLNGEQKMQAYQRQKYYLEQGDFSGNMYGQGYSV